MASYAQILLSRRAKDNSLQPPMPPKTFYLYRKHDSSGVSGQGVVAVGVQMPSGRCIVEWITDAVGEYSIGIYSSIEGVEKVHGHGGNTDIVFYTNKGGTDEEDS